MSFSLLRVMSAERRAVRVCRRIHGQRLRPPPKIAAASRDILFSAHSSALLCRFAQHSGLRCVQNKSHCFQRDSRCFQNKFYRFQNKPRCTQRGLRCFPRGLRGRSPADCALPVSPALCLIAARRARFWRGSVLSPCRKAGICRRPA